MIVKTTLRRSVGLMRRPFAALTRQFNGSRENVPGTITCVLTTEPVVALTFDDGPHPDYTPRVLDILKRHGASATFFMIGEMAERHPNIVRQVALAGHAIGNHSWNHPFFPSLSGRERREQMRACDRALAPYGQRLFRPPFGGQSLASCLDAYLLGHHVVNWSADAKDWRENDPKMLAERLEAGARPGRIILLHDAIYLSHQPLPQYDREPMLAALEIFLERLTNRLRFVTVPELLRLGRGRGSDARLGTDLSSAKPAQ